jgi:hypothetical protein
MLEHKMFTATGPVANTLFHHRPDPKAQLNSPLEAAYHKVDARLRTLFTYSRPPERDSLRLSQNPEVLLLRKERLRI